MVVDPMHNLITRTPHTVLATWNEREILNNEHFTSIQSTVDSFVPKKTGRIPHKTASGCPVSSLEVQEIIITYYYLSSKLCMEGENILGRAVAWSDNNGSKSQETGKEAK